MSIVIKPRGKGLSEAQDAFLALLSTGPKRQADTPGAPFMKDDIYHCSWSIPASLERRHLIRKRPDGRWELAQ